MVFGKANTFIIGHLGSKESRDLVQEYIAFKVGLIILSSRAVELPTSEVSTEETDVEVEIFVYYGVEVIESPLSALEASLAKTSVATEEKEVILNMFANEMAEMSELKEKLDEVSGDLEVEAFDEMMLDKFFKFLLFTALVTYTPYSNTIFAFF
ncbi:hypothetical protein ACJX0J_012511 [Zea mays]